VTLASFPFAKKISIQHTSDLFCLRCDGGAVSLTLFFPDHDLKSLIWTSLTLEGVYFLCRVDFFRVGVIAAHADPWDNFRA
jgi:hypothetical protein